MFRDRTRSNHRPEIFAKGRNSSLWVSRVLGQPGAFLWLAEKKSKTLDPPVCFLLVSTPRCGPL